MSMNDMNEWASMIINELFDENKPFENVSKSTNSKEGSEKNKLAEIGHRAKDSSECALENCEDYQTDIFNSFEKNLNYNDNNRISDDFYKTDADLTTAKHRKDRSTAHSQNVTSDYNTTSNVEKIGAIEVVTDSVEKTIDNETKNDNLISEFVPENTKEEAMLINLDETFIQYIENDSSKAHDTDKNVGISISFENTKATENDFWEGSGEKSDNLHSHSFEEFPCNNKDNENKCSSSVQSKLSKSFFEKRNLCSDNSEYEQFDENICFLAPVNAENETFSVRKNLETWSVSPQDYLNRVDEKLERIGYRSFKNNRNGDVNTKQSRSLTDLYHKWFEEFYIKEEMEFRWGSTDGSIGNESLTLPDSELVPAAEFKIFSTGKNLNENVNNMLTADEVGQNHGFEKETGTYVNFVDSQEDTINMCSNRKNKALLEENSEKVTNKLVEVKQQSLDDIHSRREKGINKYFEGYSERRDVERKRNKSIFPIYENLTRKQGEDTITEDVTEMDSEELEIRNQRINTVVITYRDFCSTLEAIFIRPFANVLIDSFEFLLFAFFLAICAFYFLFERIRFLMSNYRVPNVERKEENELIDFEKSMLRVTALETDEMLSDENISLGEEKFMSSLKKTDVIEFLKEVRFYDNVEPKDIAILSMNYELMTVNMNSLYEKGETFFSVFCSGEQHRAVIKRNDPYLIDFKLMNINKNEFLPYENYFDTEVFASSENFHCGINEIDVQPETENAYNVEEILEKYDAGLEVENVIKQKTLREIFEDNCCENEKPFLNSTEVDAFEKKSPEYKCCSHKKPESASKMDCIELYSKLYQVSPVIYQKREYLNSSLSVNVSPFSSRSDILSESVPLLHNLDEFHDDKSLALAKSFKISNEIEKDHRVPLFSINLDEPGIEPERITVNEKGGNVNEEEDENYVDNFCGEIPVNSNVSSCCSEGFQFSNAADIHFQDINNSFMCGDATFVSGSFDPSNECDLSTKDEVIDDDKANLKKKNCGLRRRMSSIFNNWRNAQVRSSCMIKIPKNKKKCDTHDDRKGK